MDEGRFSTDELNQVIENWEYIANKNNTRLITSHSIIDLRSPVSQVINRKNIDHVFECDIYHLELNIPYKGRSIKITTSETMTPKFEYPIKNPDFSFSIYQEDFTDRIIKMFGHDELQTEDHEFDKRFLLWTDNKPGLTKFLDFKVREWLKSRSICYFELNTEKSKNKLSIFYVFNEFSTSAIQEEIDMFKYCINKINC
ncbi:MAG TPA: hypothetical protein VK172_07360 [Lentimicrobium sp.]|nr:hypothetical protein [Lentimicrobium sp.]